MQPPLQFGSILAPVLNDLAPLAGHEIVDIGGFTLKRRKTQVPTGLPSGAPASDSADLQHLKTPNSPTQRGPSATCSRIPHVDEYEISEELYHRLSHSLEALPEAAAPEHRFAAVCTSVCDAEVDLAAKSGNPSLAAALADVFNAFNLSLPKAVAAGSVQLVAPVPAAEEIDQEDLKIDLHARKAGLRGRLQKFQEVRMRPQGWLAPGLDAPPAHRRSGRLLAGGSRVASPAGKGGGTGR